MRAIKTTRMDRVFKTSDICEGAAPTAPFASQDWGQKMKKNDTADVQRVLRAAAARRRPTSEDSLRVIAERLAMLGVHVGPKAARARRVPKKRRNNVVDLGSYRRRRF